MSILAGRRQFARALWLACYAAAWLLSPQPAAACGGCSCYDAPTWDSWLGVLEAPRNARLLISAPSATAVRLRTVAGVQIPVDTEASGADGLIWIRARSLLVAGESYVVEVAAAAATNSAFVHSLGFRVTPDTDTQPLQAQGSRIAASAGSPICELVRGAELISDELRDDAAPGRRVYAQLDVRVAGNETRIFLPFSAFTQEQRAEFGVASPIAPVRCVFARAIEAATSDAPASARVTYYDLGGNATQEPNAFEFTFGAVMGGACGPVDVAPARSTAGADGAGSGAGPGPIASAGAASAATAGSTVRGAAGNAGESANSGPKHVRACQVQRFGTPPSAAGWLLLGITLVFIRRQGGRRGRASVARALSLSIDRPARRTPCGA